MEGSNYARIQREQMALYSSLLSELRTPILELKLSAELEGNQQTLIIATHTLKLFDGFLYLQDIQRSDTQLALTPCSLSAATEDVLHSLVPLARMYDVEFEFHNTKQRQSVGLHKDSFMYATHGLLHASITSLQNRQGSVIRVRSDGGQKPSMRIFSNSFQANIQKHLLLNSSRKLPVPSSDGIGSGFVLAKMLYEAMGSQMRFARNQFGQGFQADFQPTRQMSLIDSLV